MQRLLHRGEIEEVAAATQSNRLVSVTALTRYRKAATSCFQFCFDQEGAPLAFPAMVGCDPRACPTDSRPALVGVALRGRDFSMASTSWLPFVASCVQETCSQFKHPRLLCSVCQSQKQDNVGSPDRSSFVPVFGSFVAKHPTWATFVRAQRVTLLGPHSAARLALTNQQPYSLRRRGATAHFREFGGLDRAAVRGRWKSTSAARLYINEGIAAPANLAAQQRRIMELARVFEFCINGHWTRPATAAGSPFRVRGGYTS